MRHLGVEAKSQITRTSMALGLRTPYYLITWAEYSFQTCAFSLDFLRPFLRQAIHLQGFLFFGSVEHVAEQVRMQLEHCATTRAVILDFRLVFGLDASALQSIAALQHWLVDRHVLLVFSSIEVPALIDADAANAAHSADASDVADVAGAGGGAETDWPSVARRDELDEAGPATVVVAAEESSSVLSYLFSSRFTIHEQMQQCGLVELSLVFASLPAATAWCEARMADHALQVRRQRQQQRQQLRQRQRQRPMQQPPSPTQQRERMSNLAAPASTSIAAFNSDSPASSFTQPSPVSAPSQSASASYAEPNQQQPPPSSSALAFMQRLRTSRAFAVHPEAAAQLSTREQRRRLEALEQMDKDENENEGEGEDESPDAQETIGSWSSPSLASLSPSFSPSSPSSLSSSSSSAGNTAKETKTHAAAATISKLVAPLLRSRNPLLRAAMKWRCGTHDDRQLPASSVSSYSSSSLSSFVPNHTIGAASARVPLADDWALDHDDDEDEDGSDDDECIGDTTATLRSRSALVGALMASIRSVEPTQTPSIRSIRCVPVCMRHCLSRFIHC
jgi:hypothetical protein